MMRVTAAARSGMALGSFARNTSLTVRVGTFDTILTGSPSRILPLFRMLSAAVMGRLSAWWQERTALVMSDEWMNEYRWSSRDRS